MQHSGSHEQPICVVMMDVDKFKVVNDTYGHACGDDVLREVAIRLSQSLRSTDLVGRVGGEEFALLLPGADMESGLAVSERCRRSLQQAPVTCRSGEVITVTASFGGVTSVGGDPDELIKTADHAMYNSKETGRNRVTWHQ